MTRKSSAVNKAVKRSAGKPKAATKQDKKRGAKTVINLSEERIKELLTQARELAWTGQHVKAIDLCTQVLDAIGKGNSRTAELQTHLLDTRAESNFALLNLDALQKDVNSMMRIANAAPPSRKGKKLALKAQELIWKGVMYGHKNKIELTRKTLSNAIKAARQSKDKRIEAESLYWQGFFQVGELQIKTYQQAADLYLSLGDQARTGRALNGLAYAYRRAGKMEESQRTAQTALLLCEQVGDNLGKSRAMDLLSWAGELSKDLRLKKQAYKVCEAAGYLLPSLWDCQQPCHHL